MKIKQLRPLTIATLILGVIAVFLFMAVINQQLIISRLSKDIKSEQKQSSELSEKSLESKKLENSYKNLSQKLGGRYRNVSWSRHLPYMVNQLTGIMYVYNLKIETLRPNPIRTIDTVSQLPLRITFKSRIGDLAKLIRDIENTDPKLNIETLDLKPSGDNSDQLQVDMLISSYAVEDKDAPDSVVAVKPVHAPVVVKISKKTTLGVSTGGKR